LLNHFTLNYNILQKVILIPTVLDTDSAAQQCMPQYIINAIQQCSVFYVENERTARRYFKSIWKEMVIDNYEWVTIGKTEDNIKKQFTAHLQQQKTIGIVSEAGCPAIADPGHQLIALAQQQNITVQPLVGPNSIVLALMASGFNGQNFSFNGYLPIETNERNKKIKELEQKVINENCTQLFIETPYRNNPLLKAILQNCAPTLLLCIAKNLTSEKEWVKTKSIAQWKLEIPELHKEPVIFVLGK
jgi:16S rRNA (cytidine1402-2'-O)-methyltransferase